MPRGKERPNCFGYLKKMIFRKGSESQEQILNPDDLARHSLEETTSEKAEGFLLGNKTDQKKKRWFGHAVVRHPLPNGQTVYSHRNGVGGSVEFFTQQEFDEHTQNVGVTPVKRVENKKKKNG